MELLEMHHLVHQRRQNFDRAALGDGSSIARSLSTLSKSSGRIDGAVALAMAVGVAPLRKPPIDIEALIGYVLKGIAAQAALISSKKLFMGSLLRPSRMIRRRRWTRSFVLSGRNSAIFSQYARCRAIVSLRK
jgi:hypothetical protein